METIFEKIPDQIELLKALTETDIENITMHSRYRGKSFFFKFLKERPELCKELNIKLMDKEDK